MIVGFTGHRKLQHDEREIIRWLTQWLQLWKPRAAISGLALGFDQLAARVCVYLGIPLVAAVPFEEQDNRWSDKDKAVYRKILSRARQVVDVSKLRKYTKPEDDYTQKFFNRNIWLVDHSDKILAYYLNTSRGGTAQTVGYAHRQMKIVLQMATQA
jgi:uncharacterized phage-like protein YoqJ